MFFKNSAQIQYDQKPIKYPFSESDFVIAHNFFKRYRINEDVFSNAVFFKKYTIKDQETPDYLAEIAYGNPYYDWMILLTNNIINRSFDWPMTNYELTKYVESKYDDPYGTIHHYETYEINAGYTVTDAVYGEKEVIALQGGLTVDETFYNTPFVYWNGAGYTSINGNVACRPITVMEWQVKENEKKREIYMLKPEDVVNFVDDFKSQNKYKKSKAYKSNRLKTAGI